MCSFYAQSSQKRKNSVKSSVSFYTFGIYRRKSCSKNIDEIDTCRQFHQYFKYKFFVQTLFWQLFSSYMYIEKAAKTTFVQKMRA